ncbi:MAG: non-ribosomal peptide synthetase, partial [Burkholderiales bacterium]
MQTYQGASHRSQLSGELTAQVKRLAQTQGATPFMVLLAAFQALLHRYTGDDDILVGSPTTGRTDARFAGVVGYFVNPVVLRADLSTNPTFKELLVQVRGTALRALEHQEFPFPLLIERLQPRRDPSYAPLFQVSFVYQKPQRSGATIDWLGWSEAAGTRSNWGGLEIEFFDLPQQEGQFDLELEVLETESSFRCVFKYNTDIFDAATIARLARHFECLLTGIVAAPHEHVDQLPLLDASERKQILQEWNATAVNYPQGAGVHQLFEHQEQVTPEAPALVFLDQRLSYAEMNQRANQLGHFLRARGVGPDSVVGVCLDRSVDMVVALHAVLKAGGAYLPLDPEYPSERLDYMANDADIALLLTHTALAERWHGGGAQVVTLDTEWPRIAGYPSHNPGIQLTPDNLAYVIYTSGSTGKPKGVAVPHRGLLNRLQWMQAQYRLDANDRVLQKTPFSFDVSVWEFFWPMMTGAMLVVSQPGDHRDSRRLIQLIRDHGITTLHFVPSM